MKQTFNHDALNRLLALLEEQLRLHECPAIDLVICGGSALIALGLVRRVTKDIDVVARLSNGALADPDPFPDELRQAIARIARYEGLPSDWLNSAPADLFRMGLPEGFKERLIPRHIGPALTVHFIGRIDQIHFKLYASVDRGGYHITDLLALKPTEHELSLAAAWTMSHDVSDGYRSLLKEFLLELGYETVARGLEKPIS